MPALYASRIYYDRQPSKDNSLPFARHSSRQFNALAGNSKYFCRGWMCLNQTCWRYLLLALLHLGLWSRCERCANIGAHALVHMQAASLPWSTTFSLLTRETTVAALSTAVKYPGLNPGNVWRHQIVYWTDFQLARKSAHRTVCLPIALKRPSCFCDCACR